MNRVIFWDSDGTLICNNESFACSFLDACAEERIPLSAEESRRLMRAICSWYRPEDDHSSLSGEEWWSALMEKMAAFLSEKGAGEEQSGRILSSFRERVIRYDYRPFADAEEVLREFAARGFRSYIISNNFPELGQVFERLGLGKYISGYITSAEAGYEKPHRRIFEIALKRAGEPEVRYMIGDNPVTDGEGGTAAGMTAVLVHRENAEGLPCCAHLKDLLKLIR